MRAALGSRRASVARGQPSARKHGRGKPPAPSSAELTECVGVEPAARRAVEVMMPLVEAAMRKLIALGGSSVPSAPCHLSRARPWARQANANGKQQQRSRARESRARAWASANSMVGPSTEAGIGEVESGSAAAAHRRRRSPLRARPAPPAFAHSSACSCARARATPVQEARVERSIGGYRAVERKRGLFLASNLGTAPRFRATVTRGSRKV